MPEVPSDMVLDDDCLEDVPLESRIAAGGVTRFESSKKATSTAGDVNAGTEAVAPIHARPASRAHAVAQVGLSVALIAVCSWMSIPLGPIPFTLQMFAVPFVLCLLTPSEAIAAIFCYVALGAVGVPVFSGMKGGIGVLLGPTGGFLLGYLLGVAVAVLFLYTVRMVLGSSRRVQLDRPDPAAWAKLTPWQRLVSCLVPCGMELIGGLVFTLIAYVTGWAQYMLVAGVGPAAAFVACVAPFVVGDIVKVVLAVLCAQSVKLALNR